MKKYCVLGNDNRSIELRKMYIDEGIKMYEYYDADVIVTPVPFSRDGIKINGETLECSELISKIKDTKKRLYSGAMSNDMKIILKESNVNFCDLMELENVAMLNAIPTAEGAIAEAINMTNFTLTGANILVLGFGNIGKLLAKMLSGIGAKVFCEARSERDLALIEAYGYTPVNLANLDMYLYDMKVIFNTIPKLILDEKRLRLLNNNCAIIDLASSPGGIDFSVAKELKINHVWALSLPSKVAPNTAAKYLKDNIDNIEKNI